MRAGTVRERSVGSVHVVAALAEDGRDAPSPVAPGVADDDAAPGQPGAEHADPDGIQNAFASTGADRGRHGVVGEPAAKRARVRVVIVCSGAQHFR